MSSKIRILRASFLFAATFCACEFNSEPSSHPGGGETKPPDLSDYIVYDEDILIHKDDYANFMAERNQQLRPFVPNYLLNPDFGTEAGSGALAKISQRQYSSTLIDPSQVGNITISIESGVPSQWIPYIDRAINHYQELSNSTAIRLTKVAAGTGNIKVYWTNQGTTGPCATGAYPSGGNPGSSIYINSVQTAFQANRALWTPAIIHEIGHTLGLTHTNEIGWTQVPTTPSDERASIMRGGSCHEPALGFTNFDHKALVYLYPPAGTRPLLRWWFGSISKHFYSLSPEAGTDPLASGPDVYEGNSGLLYTASASGRTAVYRFVNMSNNDHYYTTNYSDGASRPNHSYEGITGFINTTNTTGTLPFYRFWNSAIGDHYMDTNPNPPSGYVSDGLLGYIVAAPW